MLVWSKPNLQSRRDHIGFCIVTMRWAEGRHGIYWLLVAQLDTFRETLQQCPKGNRTLMVEFHHTIPHAFCLL